MKIRQSKLYFILIFFIISHSNYSFAITSKEDFISKVLPAIQKAKDDIGGEASKIPESLVLAQAIHESSWGNSKLAKSKKNLFGIKKNSKYAKFHKLDDCVKYYLQTLLTHDAYKDFRGYLGSSSLILIKHMKNYAEDPKYTIKISKLIKVNNLRSFDF